MLGMGLCYARHTREDPCKDYIDNHVKKLIDEYEDREKKKRREYFGWQMAILITRVR
jgi:hypothetical protein